MPPRRGPAIRTGRARCASLLRGRAILVERNADRAYRVGKFVTPAPFGDSPVARTDDQGAPSDGSPTVPSYQAPRHREAGDTRPAGLPDPADGDLAMRMGVARHGAIFPGWLYQAPGMKA